MRAESSQGARLSDQGLMILSSLAGGPKHGYAIVADVQEITGVHLGAGTLYGVLARLESDGLIEPLPASGRRRPYRITAAGSSVLEARLQALSKLSRTGLARLASLGARA